MSGEPKTSRIAGFYKRSIDERLQILAEFAALNETEIAILRGSDPARLQAADKMVENVVGLFHLPVGVAMNFRVDDRDRLLPMVIEEPSVVAAASHAAKLLRGGSGIETRATAPLMIGQIQILEVADPAVGAAHIEAAASDLIAQANASQPRLLARGGGARELEVRVFEDTTSGPMVVVHLVVDVCDAMGANLVNQMMETLAADCAELSGGRVNLRILSNLADRRLVEAIGRVPFSALARPKLGLDGATVAARIEEASVFAEVDPYRAATHNKGMMNGIDAFLIATGQDWRAVEAGVHAYGARDTHYAALATWRREGEHLVGRLKIPMQVGTVGGVTKVHPVVKVLLKILDVSGASDVGRLAAAVGLAQNLAAIVALATEGIQRGHMSLHARNIAAAVGASNQEIDAIVAEMIRRQNISHESAKSIMDEVPSVPTSLTKVTVDELEDLRDAWWPQVEAFLEGKLRADASPGTLDDMVRYQLDSGGKRLRALIPLAMGQAMGVDLKRIVPFAGVMELVHNATLVHLDAERRHRIRRGCPTLWVRYGLDQAINCGDGLFYLALKCLDDLAISRGEIGTLKQLVVDQLLHVVRAQIDDRLLEHASQSSSEEWLGVAEARIGGLFKLAVMGGAIVVGVTEDPGSRLEDIGQHLGAVFLVQDELMDLLGTRSQRRRGQAIIDGKLTLVLSHFLNHAPPPAREQGWEILTRPARETTDEDVLACIRLLHAHGSLDAAFDIVREHQQALAAHLSGLPAPLAGLFRGMTEIFMAPLLRQLTGG